jgi:hypothetical protein
LDFLKSYPRGDELVASSNGCILETHLILGISDYKKRETAIKAIRAKANTDANQNSADTRAREIVENIQWFSRNSSNMTQYLVAKIELAQSFTKDGQ